MSKQARGWMKVIGSGAAAAGLVIAAAPVAPVTFILAGLAFLTSSGAAADALYSDKPAKKPPATPAS